jgi:polyhydroxybutyrate depolymerase
LQLIRVVRSRKLSSLVGACQLLAGLAACSSDAPSDSPSVAGAGGATAGAGSGTSASGGASSAGSSPGGAGKAGMSGTAGSGSGGAAGSGGGGAASSAGTGGSAVAGSAGTGGHGSGAAAKPSAGCSKGTARPAGGKVEVSGTSLHLFPESYDGKTPYPLLIALHACGNQNTEFVNLTNGTGFATEFVRTFPNTPDSGQCWSNYSGDAARVLGQYDELMNNYCIDQNRVFATAHSSGAQLLVNILSHKSDAEHLGLKGIAPVAADPYNVAVPMPVMYIDGVMDNQRSANSAKDTVAKFRAANSCMDTSKPYSAVMACNSTESGHPMVDPGCNIYDGCSVPTIWCAHNDPAYSGTQHGVPCFAMKSMYDFFATL